MKRAFAIVGLFLLIAPRAFAACPESPYAQALLNQTPISQYVQDILDRTDDAIARAKAESSGNSMFEMLLVDWIGIVASALLSLVDTKVQVVEHSADLERVTACEHIDISILEAKIEQVRCELNVAQDNRSPGGVLRLKSLLSFLADRLGYLQLGATDPQIKDPGWQGWYFFDDPFNGWCCQYADATPSCTQRDVSACIDVPGNFYSTKKGCLNDVCFQQGDDFRAADSPKYAEACPFDSDYLAPNTSGYGCHPEVLGPYAGSIGIPADKDGAVAEKEALTDLNAKRDDFIDNVEYIRDVTMAVNQFMNVPDDPRLALFGNTKTGVVPHRSAAGCDADVPDFTGFKPSAWWAAIALRSPFSFIKDELTIWYAFDRLMARYADDREYPNYLKKPVEFWTEQDREDAAKRENAFLWMLRNPLRDDLKIFVGNQAALESAVYPKVVDTPQLVVEAMKPVRSAMKEATKLIKPPGTAVGDGKSLRTFVRDFAYFLRRSCIDRPCKSQLDTVLKIIFQDDCFPYTKGEFGKDEPWQKCKDSAGL